MSELSWELLSGVWLCRLKLLVQACLNSEQALLWKAGEMLSVVIVLGARLLCFRMFRLIFVLDLGEILVAHLLSVLDLHDLKLALVVLAVAMDLHVLEKLSILFEALVKIILGAVKRSQVDWVSLLHGSLLHMVDQHGSVVSHRMQDKIATLIVPLRHISLHFAD